MQPGIGSEGTGVCCLGKASSVPSARIRRRVPGRRVARDRSLGRPTSDGWPPPRRSARDKGVTRSPHAMEPRMPHRRDGGTGFVPPGCPMKQAHAVLGAPVTNRQLAVGHEPTRDTACVRTGIAAPGKIQGGSTGPPIPDRALVRSRRAEATREAEAGIRLPFGGSAPAAGRSPSSESSFASDRRHSTDMGKNDAMAHDCR